MQEHPAQASPASKTVAHVHFARRDNRWEYQCFDTGSWPHIRANTRPGDAHFERRTIHQMATRHR